MKKTSNISSGLKCEYEKYRKGKIMKYLIIFLILGATFTIFEAYYAGDSIIEIRFADDFSIQADTKINGFDFSDMESKSLRIDQLNISDFTFLAFQLTFIDKNAKTIVQFTPKQKNQFVNYALYFSTAVDELTEYQALRTIGNIDATNVIRAGNVCKLRMNRGYYLLYMEVQMIFTPSYFNTSFPPNQGFGTSVRFMGFTNSSFYDLQTNHETLIFTIHSFNYSQDAFNEVSDFYEAIDSGNLHEDQINNWNIPDQYPYFMNVSVSRGSYFDIFDANIK